MKVFVDTSALLATADAGDAHHAEAVRWLRAPARSDERLVVSSYVAVEVLSLASRRLGMEAAASIQQALDRCEAAWVTPAEHREAVRDFLRSGRGLSFVDCSSFAVMRRRGIERAFAFDDDFRRAGFAVAPG